MAADPPPSPEGLELFEKRIRPLLVDRCFKCHSKSAPAIKGGLALDNRASVLRGGESGPVVAPGEPEKSPLLAALRYGEGGAKMPPEGKLPDDLIADVERWIALGAPDPRDGTAVSPSADDPARRWAFSPLGNPEPPEVGDKLWNQRPIDRFIYAGLAARGLTPSGEVGRRALARRLHVDLIGLPPTAEAQDKMAAAKDARAYKELVDSLLASPHFGERFGRYWLDVARYGDTKGYVFMEDRVYAEAYTYRDWVIRALNDDMPYDEFILRQLAADRLPAERQSLEAMGFLTLGRRFLNNSHDIIDDRIDVVCRGLLGLTVTCARCHDHKYDPITMQDYYALYGVFASSHEPGGSPSALRLVDRPQTGDHPILLRGQPGNHGPVAPRRFLAALSPNGPQPLVDGSGRLELAQAIVSRDNPLTARVIVNRVWGQLMGQGLVRTPSDLGTRSDPPSHPELLDYLARQFMEQGWSLKKLIREIVLSRAYRQESQDREECAAVDPENTLLWRMNRRRLDLESLRDALLAAAGTLDESIGGPSVDVTKSPTVPRRTVYAHIDRQNLPALFRSFDFANPDGHAPKRYQTTVPQQALFLLNSPFALEQACALAERSRREGRDEEPARIKALFRAAYARSPTKQETTLAQEFLDQEREEKSVAAPGWLYGHGQYDGATKRVTAFHKLPHFTGQAWQGGPNLPDAKLGWVTLNAHGGHPGNNLRVSAIRRLTLPEAGTLTVTGQLKHGQKEGDGVRALVVHPRRGLRGEWTALGEERATPVEPLDVQAGDKVDFVVECRKGPDFDSFTWTVKAELQTPGGVRRFDSAADFLAPAPPAQLDPWQRLAHVLLMSNEFYLVD